MIKVYKITSVLLLCSLPGSQIFQNYYKEVMCYFDGLYKMVEEALQLAEKRKEVKGKEKDKDMPN